MKSNLSTFTKLLALLTALVCSLGLVSLQANADTFEPLTGNCPNSVLVPGNQPSYVVSAPAGSYIISYCVKASANRGDSGQPVIVTLAEPVTTLVLRHPGGGNLTHYSLVTSTSGTPSPTPQEPTESTSPTSGEPFNWDWTYQPPTCDALTVLYPPDLPSGQANDVNIKLSTASGDLTLNYHNNTSTWSEVTTFPYASHPQWPSELSSYSVVWVQVAGTNYHWSGNLVCSVSNPEQTQLGYAPAREMVSLKAASSTFVNLKAGNTPAVFAVKGPSDVVATVEQLKANQWVAAPKLTVSHEDGNLRVQVPVRKKKGMYSYRLKTADTPTQAQATSAVFTLRVK